MTVLNYVFVERTTMVDIKYKYETVFNRKLRLSDEVMYLHSGGKAFKGILCLKTA